MSAAAERPSPYPDDFYGFRDVPFHIHLGMRFERPEPAGPAVVTLPGGDSVLGAEGAHSPAAVYTVAEVASGISVCDALALYGAGEDTTLVPLVLTRHTSFEPRADVGGELHSRARLAEDPEAATGRLRATRKASIEVECDVLGEDDTLAGRLGARFYLRMMSLSLLESIAGQMVPGMAERAREVLGAVRAARP
jgi:hypothetical protein